MTIRLSVTHPRVGAYIVDLPSYQWEYTDGGEYLARDLGTTSVGVHYTDPLNTQRRTRVMRFILTEPLQLRLRTLGVFAQRFVRDVRFWPDYDDAPGTFWDLDWATEVAMAMVLDNRNEAELTVVEKVSL
jgi:hypothetical protein